MKNTFNFSRLIGKMAEKGETRESLSKKIGITPQTFTRKLKNLSPFYTDEVLEISKILGIEKSDFELYFFNLIF